MSGRGVWGSPPTLDAGYRKTAPESPIPLGTLCLAWVALPKGLAVGLLVGLASPRLHSPPWGLASRVLLLLQGLQYVLEFRHPAAQSR